MSVRSENIKENVSKFGISLAHSQLSLNLQNVTAFIYKSTNNSVQPVDRETHEQIDMRRERNGKWGSG